MIEFSEFLNEARSRAAEKASRLALLMENLSLFVKNLLLQIIPNQMLRHYLKQQIINKQNLNHHKIYQHLKNLKSNQQHQNQNKKKILRSYSPEPIHQLKVIINYLNKQEILLMERN